MNRQHDLTVLDDSDDDSDDNNKHRSLLTPKKRSLSSSNNSSNNSSNKPIIVIDDIYSGFVTLSGQERFTKRVEEIVSSVLNNSLFWNNLMQANKLNNFETRIQYSVDNQLRSQVPKIIMDQLTLVLSNMVHKEMTNQLPGYLNNNHTMQSFLQSHKEGLQIAFEDQSLIMESKLTALINETVRKIVNEDQYHIINKAYFDAFKVRGDEMIQNVSNKATKAIADLSTELKESKLAREKQQKHIDNFQDKIAQLTKDNVKMKEEIKSLDSWTFNCAIIVGAVFVSTLVKFIR